MSPSHAPATAGVIVGPAMAVLEGAEVGGDGFGCPPLGAGVGQPWSSREAVFERLEESRSYAALLSVSLICFSRYRTSLAVSP